MGEGARAPAGTSAAGSSGFQAASTPAPSPSATGGPGTVTVQRPPVADTPDSLDLISPVAMPLVKRFAPALAGLLAGIIAGMLLGRRRRFIIVMTEPPRRG
jgi:hypothetical protein